MNPFPVSSLPSLKFQIEGAERSSALAKCLTEELGITYDEENVPHIGYPTGLIERYAEQRISVPEVDYLACWRESAKQEIAERVASLSSSRLLKNVLSKAGEGRISGRV